MRQIKKSLTLKISSTHTKFSNYRENVSNSDKLTPNASAIFTNVEYFGSIVPHSIRLIVLVVNPVFKDKSS